jgi:hypothetical protein
LAIEYVLIPFITWLMTGLLKFAINLYRARNITKAVQLIGYGGAPSNHSAIVSSTAAYIALTEGLLSPEFMIALTLAFIVIMDAAALRKRVEEHAKAINELGNFDFRTRIGHSTWEIVLGILWGSLLAWLIFMAKSDIQIPWLKTSTFLSL